MLLAPIDAVKAAEPGPTATTMKPMLEEPAAIDAVAGTVATLVLLLVSETVAPPAGAGALSVTVPVTLPAATTLAGLIVTADTAVVAVGVVVEPPHCVVLRRPRRAAKEVIDERKCLLTCFMLRCDINIGATRFDFNNPA
jgi:hypothetical protein